MKTPRQVKIKRVGDTWMVFYVDRKKGQHYTAAQFYASEHTIHDVENWIHQHPTLTLIQ